MSWKKNVFGCVMWVVYLLMVVAAMMFTGRVICDSFGIAEYLVIIISAVYLLLTGILVFVLHRLAVSMSISFQGVGKTMAWIERILVIVLFAAGIFLRVLESQPELFVRAGGSDYLKLAYISADGQGIPQFSHGALYLYIWGLRLCFMLLGNKVAAALWMQIVLQLSGVLLLYLAVRKMAGRIPALMMAAFFMLSPYMVDKALVLSPEMLYLLFFSFVLLFISQGVQYVFGWGFWLAAGVMAAVLSYLDVAGFLLLPLMPGIIFMRRQNVKRKIAGGLTGCLIGFLSGAAGCVLVDMVSSGKPVSGIIRAWKELYQWENMQFSVTVSSFDTVWTITLIVCFMAWGIFGFWCGRGEERFTVWIFCLCVTVLMQGLGVFTEEMEGFCYIFFFSTVLAGLGIRESMAVCPAEEDWDNGANDIARRSEKRMQTAGEENETVEDGNKAASKDSVGRRNNIMEETIVEESTMEETATAKREEVAEKPEQKPKIEFLENPLPLPKKHKKRVMDYKLNSDKDLDGYDIDVSDDDDFDY